MKCADDHSPGVRDFWNSRALFGKYAGTRDLIAKKLEIEAIISFVQDGMKILDVGCGNGLTAVEMARRFNVRITGIDFADEMITSARQLAAGQSLKGTVHFELGDVTKMSQMSEKSDLIFTERTLINLPDWPTQIQAICDICNHLVPDGLYIMCENSQDGLDKINMLRKRVGLSEVTPPWHNRYLRDEEVAQAGFEGIKLEKTVDFSSTYYFLSRVVNAWLAKNEGIEPDYEAEVNKLALELPSIGDLGQGRIWVWRRTSQDITVRLSH